jgi:hypothetical protein
MSKIVLAILLSLFAAPAWATTYYLATAAGGGSDSNNGLSAGAPWATPNHAVNCGDVILAAAGPYSSSSFGNNWGKVSCPAANNVAWLKCASIGFTCVINGGGLGMQMNQSWWGVQGWLIENVSTCININPSGSPGAYVTTHHVIVANSICVNASGNGFNTNNYLQNASCDPTPGSGPGPGPCPTAGVDYQNFIGNWVYKAASTTGDCYAAFSIYEPVNYDTAPGTHIYEAGNLANDVVNSACSGGKTYSGDVFLMDTMDGESQFLPSPYSGQVLIDNNICIYDGGRCYDAYDSYRNGSNAVQYIRHNTAYAVMSDPNQWNVTYPDSIGGCAAFVTRQSDNNAGPSPYSGYGGDRNATFTRNLTQTTVSTGCGGSTIYDFVVQHSTNINVTDNFSFTASGSYEGQGSNNNSVTFSNEHEGSSPGFANPTDPGAPNCGAYATVPACFATVVANFTPSGAAVGYGYQVPGPPVSDPLFPQWLCTVTLPPGLVTMGCGSAASPSAPGPPSNVKVLTIQ